MRLTIYTHEGKDDQMITIDVPRADDIIVNPEEALALANALIEAVANATKAAPWEIEIDV